MRIVKYELPVNRDVKSYELHSVIELCGMSSCAGRWVGTVVGGRAGTAWQTAFGRLYGAGHL